MSAATSKRSGTRANSIGGFFPDKIDGAIMRKYLLDAEVSTESVDPTADSDEALGVALSLYFREQYPDEDDLCKCEPCGGEGPVELPACAFCGLVAPVDGSTDTASLATQIAAEEPKAKKSKKNKEAGEEPGETIMEAAATVTHLNGKAKKSTALALAAVPAEAEAIMLTSADLDASVARVVTLKGLAATSYWALGDELRKINENKLWKLRTNPKGKAKYTSFDQFVEQEAKLSHSYAYSLIEIATTFAEEDVKLFGTTKLTLMLKVAPEDLPKIKEVAKTKSRRALAVEVEKVVKERGHGSARAKSEQHAKAGKKGGAKIKERAVAKTHDKITVASIEGRKTVKLYAKPDNIRNIDWSSLKRAKTVDAMPFGKLELTNEVSIYLSVVKSKTGELEIIANTRRDVSEE